MTSFSCAEMSASICAMRALIIASVSAFSVTVPLSTSLTKFLTRSLPRSFAAASRPMRPSSTILSRRLSSGENVRCLLGSVPGPQPLPPPSDPISDFELLHRVRVIERALKNLFELVVALQAAAEIGELAAELEQFLERPDLLAPRPRAKSRPGSRM